MVHLLKELYYNPLLSDQFRHMLCMMVHICGLAMQHGLIGSLCNHTIKIIIRLTKNLSSHAASLDHIYVPSYTAYDGIDPTKEGCNTILLTNAPSIARNT